MSGARVVERQPEQQRAARPKRVLVCDDEPDVTRLVARFLGFSGFQVETLSDPREVISRLAAEPVDLLVLDLLMPELNGEEVLAQLRAREDALAETKVLILTAKLLTPSQRAHLRELRATVMQKPFLLHELLQRVHQVVS